MQMCLINSHMLYTANKVHFVSSCKGFAERADLAVAHHSNIAHSKTEHMSLHVSFLPVDPTFGCICSSLNTMHYTMYIVGCILESILGCTYSGIKGISAQYLD